MQKEITQDASAIANGKGRGSGEPGKEGTQPAPGWGGGGGPEPISGTRYLLRPLLLLHAVADHHVDRFPAEPLHDPLEAALLACTREKGKETALAEHPGLPGLLSATQVLAGSSRPPRAAHGAVRPRAACVQSPSAREG